MKWTFLSNLVSTSVARTRVRLGPQSRCEWVRERMGAYYQWDLIEAEFRAVSRHIGECPECARVWRETEQTLAQLEASSSVGEALTSFPADDFLAATMDRIGQYEADQAAKTVQRQQRAQSWGEMLFPRISMPRLAAVSMLALSVSAMAYFAPQVWRQFSRPQQDPVAVFSQKPVVDTGSRVVVAPPSATACQPKLAAAPQSLLAERVFGSQISAEIDNMTADVQGGMLLPHTEAEWEAWAREEYPHVMWVYDVLTLPEYGINWDGKPVNVPEWANCVWVDPAIRPTGWRALVCYSGEILKFDCPSTVYEPKVKPTIRAMTLASAVSGYELELTESHGLALPDVEFCDLDLGGHNRDAAFAQFFKMGSNGTSPKTAAPENFEQFTLPQLSIYAGLVAADPARTERVLRYVATSSQLMPNATWRDVQCRAEQLLSVVEAPVLAACDAGSLRERLCAVLLAYRQNARGVLQRNSDDSLYSITR